MVCDLAEVYHIFNYKECSPLLVGTLVFGLSRDSRVKMKLAGRKITLQEELLARIADELRFQTWAGYTKDGRHNRNRPKSLTETLLEREKKEEYATFETMEEFERMWSAI